MSKSELNIVGIGCDFQNETEDNSRKMAIESLSGGEKDKVKWMLEHMHSNKAYLYKAKNKSKKEREFLLKKFKDQYINYRKNWKEQPTKSFQKKFYGKKFKEKNFHPLCLDIEVASICDLACGFCYRRYISTPDKIMKKELCGILSCNKFF